MQVAAVISMVERETGLSKETLRMWERRYGFPLPGRDPLGQRLYPSEQVQKLRVISRLLDRGHRPGQLIHLSLPELTSRFDSEATLVEPREDTEGRVTLSVFEKVVCLLKSYDQGGLREQFSLALLRLGLQRFVIEFAALWCHRTIAPGKGASGRLNEPAGKAQVPSSHRGVGRPALSRTQNSPKPTL